MGQAHRNPDGKKEATGPWGEERKRWTAAPRKREVQLYRPVSSQRWWAGRKKLTNKLNHCSFLIYEIINHMGSTWLWAELKCIDSISLTFLCVSLRWSYAHILPIISTSSVWFLRSICTHWRTAGPIWAFVLPRSLTLEGTWWCPTTVRPNMLHTSLFGTHSMEEYAHLFKNGLNFFFQSCYF